MSGNHPLIHVAGKVPAWASDLTHDNVANLRALMAEIAAHARAQASKTWRPKADGLMARYRALEHEAALAAMGKEKVSA